MSTKNLLYTESHEWIDPDGDVRRVGITDHAQHMLGDIVFVDLPQVGKVVAKGDELVVIESPKAAASVYAPVAGEVVEVNEKLETAPETINREPYGDGWIVKIRPASWNDEKGSLLDEAGYQKMLDEA